MAANSKRKGQQDTDEAEETIRELVDATKDVLRDGLADRHLVDIYNVIVNRSKLILERDGDESSNETKKMASGESPSGTKNSGTKSSNAKNSSTKSSSGAKSSAGSKNTKNSSSGSTAKSSTAAKKSSGSSRSKNSSKEQLYTILNTSRFQGVEVRIVGKSKKDPEKSNLEVVNSTSDTYPVGKKLAVKTHRLVEI